MSSEPMGLVFNVQRYSVHDGPGIRTTVFLKGCPLHCLWCHNPESMQPGAEVWLESSRCIGCGACLEVCPSGAQVLAGDKRRIDRVRCRQCGHCVEACFAGALEMVGREVGLAEVMTQLEADRAFYEQSGGGVTVSGGEPLLQPHFAAALLLACRARGLHAALDTSGHAPWRLLEEVARQADLVLYDVKHTDPDAHRRLTGVDNSLILANLRLLLDAGLPVAVRLPIVTGCNDEDSHFEMLSALLVGCATRPLSVDLLPYHGLGEAKHRRLGRAYSLQGEHTPGTERLMAIARVFAERGLTVNLPD